MTTKKPKIVKPSKNLRKKVLPGSDLSDNQYFSDNPSVLISDNKLAKRPLTDHKVEKRVNQNFDVSGKPFDAKSILTSLISSDMNSGPPFMAKFNGKRDMAQSGEESSVPKNMDSLALDSFASLSEKEPSNNNNEDFLGEVSLAFTSTPVTIVKGNPIPTNILTNSSSHETHSNSGIEEEIEATKYSPTEEEPVEGVNKGVPTEPLEVKAVIVKPRFVTLSWTEPATTNGDILVYAVIYNVNGSLR